MMRKGRSYKAMSSKAARQTIAGHRRSVRPGRVASFGHQGALHATCYPSILLIAWISVC